jgi:Tfp pilus assembly protein PilN
VRHALNLIDAKLLPSPAQPSLAMLLGVLGLAIAGAAGHLSWERMQFARTLALPGAAEAAAEHLEPSDPAFEQRLAQVQRDEALRDALAGFSDLPLDSAARLRALAGVLPDSLWLTEVEFSGRTGLRIAGGALDTAALPGYVARLGQIDGLRGLRLQFVSVEPHSAEAVDADATQADASAAARAAQHRFVLASSDMPSGEGGGR